MFNTDLKFGKRMEKEFASRLLKYDSIKSIEFSEGEFTDYDIRAVFNIGGKLITKDIEVKCDTVFTRTNGVGIEFQYDGMASGIFKSKADCVVYKLGEKFWCVDRAKLLVYLTQADKTYKSGGDGGKSELWVIPAEEFYKLGKEI